MKLTELVNPAAIVPNLQSTDRTGAIRELVQSLADTGSLPAESVEGLVRSIVTRERTRGTTGFGKGVAAPHAKLDNLDRVAVAVGRSTQGIDFSALDGGPVYVVFLIVSPNEQPEQHLRAMDFVYRHLQQEKFRKFLRQSDTVEKIVDLLREADEKLLVT